MMEDVRCPKCNKLLFKARLDIIGSQFRIEIICKCKAKVFWPRIGAGVVEKEFLTIGDLSTTVVTVD